MASVAGGSERAAVTATAASRVAFESFGSRIGASPKLVRIRSKIRIVYLHFAESFCEYAWARPSSLRFDNEGALRAG
jgi:hypothetical protein